ncbi:MAG: alanine racemase C-terminal domain-containing protein [Flavonifractor plautii]
MGIEETRWLPKGHTVGSARPVVLRRPTRVAVLPVGYQNGFGVARAQGSGLGALLRRWLAARRRTVRVNGQRARILRGPSVPLRPWWTSPTSSAPPAIRRCSTSTPCTHGGLCGSTGSPAALGCRPLQQTKRREFERCAQLLPE